MAEFSSSSSAAQSGMRTVQGCTARVWCTIRAVRSAFERSIFHFGYEQLGSPNRVDESLTVDRRTDGSVGAPLHNTISVAAAADVSANSDLLIEILIRLDTRSLTRFKSVSKSWLSLITSRSFALIRNPDSSIVSGLYLNTLANQSVRTKVDFIPLINTTHDPHPQYTDFVFFSDLSGTTEIINSCHGLLLCRFCHTRQSKRNFDYDYVILNPTTKHFKFLPKWNHSDLRGLTLAFDPSKSPHCKVICLHQTGSVSTYTQAGFYHQIMTYSSETGSWKAFGVPFAAQEREYYRSRAYWNGAVNWFSDRGRGDSVYYNVYQEQMGIIPLPPKQEDNILPHHWPMESRQYGESGGHLHLVEINAQRGRVDVYEMERDYSGWCVIHSVDLDAIEVPWRSATFFMITILSIVRMERDEDSFMVLHVPDKILRYSFADGTLNKIRDVVVPEWSELPTTGSLIPSWWYKRCLLRYSWFDTYQYIESLHGV